MKSMMPTSIISSCVPLLHFKHASSCHLGYPLLVSESNQVSLGTNVGEGQTESKSLGIVLSRVSMEHTKLFCICRCTSHKALAFALSRVSMESTHYLLQAYECLSDKAKRNAFNSQRWSNLCKECYRRYRSMEHVHRQRCWQSTGQASSYKVMNNLRQMQKRFREECEVIESCMRANQSYWKESPVFSPYEQLLSSPGYPHSREATTLEKPMSSSHWQARDQCGRGAGCESPIYEIRKHNYPRSRSFCFRF